MFRRTDAFLMKRNAVNVTAGFLFCEQYSQYPFVNPKLINTTYTEKFTLNAIFAKKKKITKYNRLYFPHKLTKIKYK